ncbi:MAG TPA: EamA family transporter RarD [Actinomycetes bacterium]|nr:EamA family transporter RarD [Actinomycetes bacterium]
MGEERRGIAYAATAYVLWGLFPLYFEALKPARPLEVLSHRVVWSLVFCLLLGLVRRHWAWVRLLLRDPRRLLLVCVAACVIALNWGVYIWAVEADHVVDASLGYFVNPLVTVLAGVIVLHERLRRAQLAAVGIAGLAVAVLTVAYGRPPVIAIVLALSFATYGLVKKVIDMPALESLTSEATVLFLPCIVVLLALHQRGSLVFGSAGADKSALLAAAGPITAIPLLLFSAGVARVALTTAGLLQYITPVIQFLIGVLVFHEALPPARLAGFVLVWVALGVLAVDVARQGGTRPAVVPAGPRLEPDVTV